MHCNSFDVFLHLRDVFKYIPVKALKYIIIGSASLNKKGIVNMAAAVMGTLQESTFCLELTKYFF